MYGDLVPNLFETPQPTHKPRRWLMPLVLTAIVIGATVALVAVNKAPSVGVQTSLVR
jgi:multisubunit Na+/H+ antiporter MnhC subunit